MYAQQLVPPSASRPGLRLVAINTNLYSAVGPRMPWNAPWSPFTLPLTWSPFTLPQTACSLAKLSDRSARERARELEVEEASRLDGVTAATPDFRATGGAKP